MSTVLADKIADDVIEALFTNGSNQKACRLVLELGNRQNGGGWSKFAARDHIIDIIDRHLASREVVEHNMHPTVLPHSETAENCPHCHGQIIIGLPETTQRGA